MTVVRIVLLVLAATCAAGIGPLHAQNSGNLPSQSLGSVFSRTIYHSLENWVWEIMRFGNATASIGYISTRSVDGALMIDGMSLNVPGLDLSVETGRVVLERPRLSDGDFVALASNMTLNDVAIKQGQMEFVAETLVVEKAALPRLDIARLGATDSGVDKFERQRQFLEQLLGIQAGSVTIPKLTVRTYSTKKDTELLGESIYRNNVLSDVRDRRIGQWQISSTLSLSPPLEPILSESFQDTVFTDLNMDAITSLLDPSAQWNSREVILGGLSVRDYAVSIGGLTLTIDAVKAANLALEPLDQTTKEHLITVAKSPNGIDGVPSAEVAPFLLNLVSAFDIENLELKQLQTQALGIDYFTIGSMGLSEASLGGFAEADVQDFRASLTDLGALHVHRATIKNVDFPDKDFLREKMDGGEVSTANLIPTLSSVFLDGFDANLPELALNAGIQTLDLQTRTDASGTPNAVEVTLEELRIPTALIPEGTGLLARLTGILRTMDADTLELNQSLTLQYNASQQTLTLEQLDVDIQDLGRLQMAARIDDVTTSPFADPAKASSTLRKGKLMDAQITFTNHGVVEAGFDAQAEKLNTKGDVLRGQVGATLPFLVAVLQNQRFQKELVAALQAFLPKPDGLIVELKPDAAGVAIADIERQLRGDPRKLLALLGVTIQNKPDSPSDSSEQLPN